MVDVPPCPPGSVTAPPDFVGVGVQKAGTSWWHTLLLAHPEVHEVPGANKELHYFDRFWRYDFTAEDAATYAELFPRPPGTKAGEWTPRYMHDFWAAPLLHESAPEARLLVLLRDPVARFESAVNYRNRPLAPARVAKRQQRGAVVVDRAVRETNRMAALATDALDRGFYHRQLTRLQRYFPAERILVLQHERCQADPVPQLRRTYEFLGLDDTSFVPDGLRTRVNAADEKPFTAGDRLRDHLRELYEDDVRALAADHPELDPRLWPAFAHLAARV